MPRSNSTQDFDHFDDWESFTMDDDIYAGTESDTLEDWEDDGAIAEVRSEPIRTFEEDDMVSEPIQLDEESAEVFSLLERATAKRNQLQDISGPSEEELSTIENIGIDDYIDAVLSEADNAIAAEEDGEIQDEITAESDLFLPSHDSDVQEETALTHELTPSEFEEDEADAFEDDENISIRHSERSEESEEVVMETFGDFGDEVDLVVQPLFEGIAVALPTLFDEDSDVEYKTTARLAKRIANSYASAVFVCTPDGEGTTLSRKERKNLVKEVARQSDEMVVVDVTAPSIRQSVQLADDVASQGANAFVITLDAAVRDPYRLCEEIHNAHYDMPLFVRLVGAPDTLPVTPEFLYDLPISGVIDATGDAGFLLHLTTAYTGPVYIGTTELILMGHALGVAGVVSAGVAIHPDLVAAAFNGDAQAASELALWERDCGGLNPHSIKLSLEQESLIAPTIRD